MIKPEEKIDILSKEILDIVEKNRIDLVSILKKTTENPENKQLFDDLKLPDGFLSKRLRKDLSDGIQSKLTNNIYGDIEAIRIANSLNTILREIYSYFLKYRYIDLSSIKQTGNRTYSIWDLPEGCDSFWQDVVHSDSGDETEIMKMLPQRVTSIPWLGNLKKDKILRSLWWLLEMGLLEFGYDSKFIDGHLRKIPVIRLKNQIKLGNQLVDAKLKEHVKEISKIEANRESIFSLLGIGVSGVGTYQTYKLFDRAGTNDTIKIATYHLRTVVATKQISEWIKEKPTLKVKILCLGPKASETLSEGADSESLLNSLKLGIQQYKKLKNELHKNLKKNVSLRIYGDVEDDSYFRGSILCDSGSNVKSVLTTGWLYNESRGNYGNIVLFSGGSSIAMLANSYFDRAWENSVPLPIPTIFNPLKWALSSIRKDFYLSVIFLTFALPLYYFFEDWRGDAIFGIIPAVLVVIFSVIEPLKKLMRAKDILFLK